MNKVTRIFRLCARIIATPILVFAFGVFWLAFVLIIGTAFQVLSFLQDEKFDWKEHLAECNEFFWDPLIAIWK